MRKEIMMEKEEEWKEEEKLKGKRGAIIQDYEWILTQKSDYHYYALKTENA
jgi:hypothetical protein